MIGIDVHVSDEVFNLFPLEPDRVQGFAAHVLKSIGISQCDVYIVLEETETYVDYFFMTEK